MAKAQSGSIEWLLKRLSDRPNIFARYDRIRRGYVLMLRENPCRSYELEPVRARVLGSPTMILGRKLKKGSCRAPYGLFGS